MAGSVRVVNTGVAKVPGIEAMTVRPQQGRSALAIGRSMELAALAAVSPR
jgi:hypothetical protein